MKKIMFVLATVLVASITEAATFTWGSKLIMDGWDGGANKISGTAYIFLASEVDRATAQGYITSKDVASIKSKAYDSASISTGAIDSSSPADDAITAPATFYFIALNDDESQAYMSGDVTVNAFETLGYTEVGWGSQKSATNVASGWSQVGGSAVPEPTSGLLLLVGAGMLALRRKQK